MGKIFLGGAPLGVEANPSLAGTETALTGLEVDGTKYKVQSGSSVTPNPSTAGTEPKLTALDVDGAVYIVDSGAEVVANPSGTGSTDLTKLQVGSGIYNIPQGTEVVANPTLAGTEGTLTGLEVDGTKYVIPEGSSVEANPTLAGTEADLTGIEIDGVKYNVPKGSYIATMASTAQISTESLAYINAHYREIPCYIPYSISSLNHLCLFRVTSQSGSLLVTELISTSTTSGSNVAVWWLTAFNGTITLRDSVASKVIANPSGTGSTDLTKLTVGTTIYNIPQGTEVAANPTLAGTETALTGLEVDGTKYKVNQPTEVVANPSGTSAADLTKLQVGSDIYNVSSGSDVAANVQLQGNEPTLKSLSIDSQSYAINGLLYSSTAPTAANTDGTIKIALLESEPAVKYDGWIYIIVVTYNITSTITNGTTTGATKIKENGTASVTIVPESGYDLPSAVIVTGASYTYDNTTGEVVLSNPTSAVTIEAACTAKNYIITAAITNGTDSGSTTIQTGGTASVTITPLTGYQLPSSVTVTGASYTYNSSMGVVSLSSPTDNVLITATCPVQTFSITTDVTNGTAGGGN